MFSLVGYIDVGDTANRFTDQGPEIAQRITIDIGGQAAIQIDRYADGFIELVNAGIGYGFGILGIDDLLENLRVATLLAMPSLTVNSTV